MHARIGTQPGMQLAMADIERHDTGRSPLKQDFGEPAGGSADIQAVATTDIEAEVIEAPPVPTQTA